MMKPLQVFLALAICALGLPAVQSQAAFSVPIVNAGFEDPPTGTFTFGAVGGWTLGGSSGGVWNINAFPAGFWNVPAPEGNQVGWLAPAPNSPPANFSQVLTTNLQANTLYLLSGEVGHPIGFGATHVPPTIWTASLYAGINLLATLSGTGPEGSFVPFSLLIDSSLTPLFVGQPLEIRLESSNAQTAFDDISLLSGVPEPSTLIVWSLIGLTFGGGSWWQRRKLAA